MSTITHKTTCSIFDDLGFKEAEAANLKIRAQLMQELNQIIKDRYKNQSEAAEQLGVTQSRISDLSRGKIQRFTIDMLINMLSKSGRNIEITTKAA